MIDGLLADQEVCLIAFGKSARRLTPFTNNQRELREALETLAVIANELDEAAAGFYAAHGFVRLPLSASLPEPVTATMPGPGLSRS